MKNILWIILISFVCIYACKEEKVKEEYKQLQLGEFASIISKDSNDLRLVSIIDGSCSMCIVDFLELNENLLKYKSKWKLPVHYIVMTGDPLTFQVSMRKFNPELAGNIILDTNYMMLDSNFLFKKSNIDVLLIDQYDSIRISGNPFNDKDIYRQYKKYMK